MSDTQSGLGEIIRQQRVTIPLTLQELANLGGVSPSHLGRIENGDRFPSARILRKIAKPLGLAEGGLFASAGYLSPQPSARAEKLGGRPLDSYVTAVLSLEPVEVQRAVVGVLSVLKSIAQAHSKPSELPEFREYAHSKYPELDEDNITMIENTLEHPAQRAKVS